MQIEFHNAKRDPCVGETQLFLQLLPMFRIQSRRPFMGRKAMPQFLSLASKIEQRFQGLIGVVAWSASVLFQ